jgi:plasmid stabilization system protein ParE
VPKLVFRSTARKHLAGIARYIERESSREAADTFMDKIGSHCAARELAWTPGKTAPRAWERLSQHAIRQLHDLFPPR